MSVEGGVAPGAATHPKRAVGLWLVRTAKVLAGLCVGAILAELAFRFRDDGAFPHLNVYEPDAELGVRLRPGAEQKTRVEPNPVTRVRINQHGLRGDDLTLPLKDAVLVVGDSTTFGLGVEEHETFSARLAEALGQPVVNAGIPTYGPPEYEAVARRLLPPVRAKTLVYAVNLANDLFEAARPNRERHKVWDGWAVRAPTAPLSITSFPGRAWLFRESHAFFHLRRLVYRTQHPELEDAGFDTEGSWRDLASEALRSEEAARLRRRRNEASERSYSGEVEYASKRLDLADEDLVRALYAEFTGNDGEQSVRIRLARATPGDIVAPAPGEEAEPVKASVGQIRDGARFRLELERRLRERARDKPDVRRTIEAYDAAREELSGIRARAAEVARWSSPLAKRIAEAKRLADSAGSDLVVLVLPLDVEVSQDEWKKYGVSPMDLRSLEVFHRDILDVARDLGARSLDATLPLRAAEPGAFLDRDLHMTPKGHLAVAKALAKTLAEPAPPRYDPRLALGRSWLPTDEEFRRQKELTVRGSSAAHCATHRVREWLRIRCTRAAPTRRKPIGARVIRGGHGDALISVYDDVLTLLVPIVPGDTLEAELLWEGETRGLLLEWPERDMPIWRDAEHLKTKPSTGNTDAVSSSSSEPAREPKVAAELCACHRKLTGSSSCSELTASPEPSCAETYGANCEALLACAAGSPLHRPRCSSGEVNVGALGRCRPLCDSKPCSAGTCVAAHGVKVCQP
jgi:hypothetical protein